MDMVLSGFPMAAGIKENLKMENLMVRVLPNIVMAPDMKENT